MCQQVKTYAERLMEAQEFIDLVREMRETQTDFEIIDMAYEYAKDHRCVDRNLILQRAESMTKVIQLEDKVDQWLQEHKEETRKTIEK